MDYGQYQMGLRQPVNGLVRVTGIEGARAYQLPPNSVMPLFDGNEDVFFLKTTGAVGSPLNLTVVGTFRHVGCGGSSVSLRLVSGDATTGATIQNAATRIED